MNVVALQGPTDWAGFRNGARTMMHAARPPEGVSWKLQDQAQHGLWADAPPITHDGPSPRITLPAALVALCENLILHNDPGRFDLMYRLLWRTHQDPKLAHDPLDADRMQAEAMVRHVRRDMHKMKAFVRFRPIGTPGDGSETVHAAWFEPQHHIVEATAPFFMRRFAGMRWALLTPMGSASWDGRALQLGPPADRSEAPAGLWAPGCGVPHPPPEGASNGLRSGRAPVAADAGEALWLTYYAHIFNPARLKVAMMCKEMPKRYWPNLPEAVLIAPLTQQAETRMQAMIDREGTAPGPSVRGRAPAAPVVVPLRVIAPDAPTTLAALNTAVRQCQACPIGAQATQAVCGSGPLAPRWMLVGEQPGDEEDLRGQSFVGPAGRLLDRALAQLGWDRSLLYVTNAVKHFKYELRGKRRLHKTAAQREADICAAWLEHEIALVKPQGLIALGATAARALLGRPVAVMQERGTCLRRHDGLPVWIVLHPAALLRLPPAQQAAAFSAWVKDWPDNEQQAASA
jgi:uracil-DNA glycosylase